MKLATECAARCGLRGGLPLLYLIAAVHVSASQQSKKRGLGAYAIGDHAQFATTRVDDSVPSLSCTEGVQKELVAQHFQLVGSMAAAGLVGRHQREGPATEMIPAEMHRQLVSDNGWCAAPGLVVSLWGLQIWVEPTCIQVFPPLCCHSATAAAGNHCQGPACFCPCCHCQNLNSQPTLAAAPSVRAAAQRNLSQSWI